MKWKEVEVSGGSIGEWEEKELKTGIAGARVVASEVPPAATQVAIVVLSPIGGCVRVEVAKETLEMHWLGLLCNVIGQAQMKKEMLMGSSRGDYFLGLKGEVQLKWEKHYNSGPRQISSSG